MNPVAVIPMNDPNGLNFPLLESITSQLKSIFSRVFVSVDVPTATQQTESIAWLKDDLFYVPLIHKKEMPVGEDFVALYKFAAESCEPEQLLHLCFIDRLAFALQTKYCEAFIADITAVNVQQTPFIFERSEVAWQTHPQNYYEFESMVRRAGELIFGQSLDFAWCYLIVQAKRLLSILPQIQRQDISFVAELVTLMREDIQATGVDWLAWEDPFILKRESGELKREREGSQAESLKRLAYVSGMMDVLQTAVLNQP